MSNELSPLQEKLYLRLVLAGFDTDVKIVDLYNAVYPDNTGMWLTNRYMQQKLGSCIARTNDKLEKERIQTGWNRRTYRLTRTS